MLQLPSELQKTWRSPTLYPSQRGQSSLLYRNSRLPPAAGSLDAVHRHLHVRYSG